MTRSLSQILEQTRQRFSVRLTADATEAEQVAITRCNKRETKDETVLCSRDPLHSDEISRRNVDNGRGWGRRTFCTWNEETGEKRRDGSLSNVSPRFFILLRGGKKWFRLDCKQSCHPRELMLLGDSLETPRFPLLMSPYSAWNKLRARRQIGDY